MMNPEIKILWLDALKSGEYKQGRHALCKINKKGEKEYCCLGVLCEVAIKNGIDLRIEDHDGEFSYDGNVAYHPKKVADWSGLTNTDASLLIRINDGSDSFESVIKEIEKRYW